ncbi:MAG: hypothetical protein IPJ13_17675 [Saprospiraceae bacterium]|nr:hypothetical protein [Saprospiraceae bacterium]
MEGFLGAGAVSLLTAWVFSAYFKHWHEAASTGNLLFWVIIAATGSSELWEIWWNHP